MGFVVAAPELYALIVDATAKGEVPKAGTVCMQALISRFATLGERRPLVHSPEKSAQIYLAAAQGVALFSWAAKSYTEILNHQDARELALAEPLREFNGKN